MDAYVVIGMPGFRKSSLIRSLTGSYNRNIRDILLLSGKTMTTYVRTTALQSVHTMANDFVQEVNKAIIPCQATLFSLWPLPHPANPIKYPDALTYLNDLNIHGWNIKKVIVTGNTPVETYAQFDTKALPKTKIDAINKSANEMREHFGWI